MQAWGEWFKQLEASGNLRNPGAALENGGAVLTRNGQGFQTDTAMSEVKELIGGYSVIEAGSLAQATELAQGSPFLQNNPNGQPGRAPDHPDGMNSGLTNRVPDLYRLARLACRVISCRSCGVRARASASSKKRRARSADPARVCRFASTAATSWLCGRRAGAGESPRPAESRQPAPSR